MMRHGFLLLVGMFALASCAPTYDLTDEDLAAISIELQYSDDSALDYEDVVLGPTAAPPPSPVPTVVVAPPTPTVAPTAPAPTATAEPEWPSPLVIGGEFFIVNEATLRSGAEDRCEDAVRNLKVDGYGELLVAGHADERGDSASNEVLSSDRAANVRTCILQAFRGLALPAPTITILGFGESCPVTDQPEDESNRRAEIFAYRDRTNVPTNADSCPF